MTVLFHLCTKDASIMEYRAAVEWFVSWCNDHYLEINVKKTKVIIDPCSMSDRTLLRFMIDKTRLILLNI